MAKLQSSQKTFKQCCWQTKDFSKTRGNPNLLPAKKPSLCVVSTFFGNLKKKKGLFRLNLGVPRLHCLVLLAVFNVYLRRLVDVLKELREVFQTLHINDLGWGLVIHTRIDDLDLISRSQVCQTHKLQFFFFKDSCPLGFKWCKVTTHVKKNQA